MPVEALTTVERYFVENNASNMNAEEMAKIMNKPLSQIEDELRVLEQKQFEQEKGALSNLENAPGSSTAPVKKDSPLLKSFARRKEGGVTIMTGSAAQLSDEIEKERPKKTLLESQKDSLTTVRK